MRILLANSYAYPRGGDCLQMLDSARRLRDAGHDVAVFALAHSESEFDEWSGFWPTDVDFRADTGAVGKAVLALRSAYSRSVARRLREMVRSFRPDVAHLHSVQHHLTISAPCELVRLGVPIVWTLHDYRAVCPSTHLLYKAQPCERCARGRFYRALPLACKSESVGRTAAAVAESYLARLSGVFAHVDRFVAPSRFLASTLARMGFDVSRLDVLPNPIQTSSTPQSRGRNEVDVLYVGRLSAEKGCEVLLRACRSMEGVRLAFVGDGPMMAQLEGYAELHGIDASFVGWQAPEGVRAWMQASRLLCVPSICYENCPGVVLEGMEAGVPVLASNRGGLPELLDNGRCGYLVEAGVEEAWAVAISSALSDSGDSNHRVASARARLQKRHDPQAHTEALVRIYCAVSAQSTGIRNDVRRPE